MTSHLYTDDYLDTTTTRALFNARSALKRLPLELRSRAIAIGDTLGNIRGGRPSDNYREAVALLEHSTEETYPERFAREHREREAALRDQRLAAAVHLLRY